MAIFGLSDQRKILRYIKSNISFRNLGVYIALAGGLRIGEVCGLTWDDLDAEIGIVRIRKTVQRLYHVDGDRRYTELSVGSPKSPSSVRCVPMTDDLARIVRAMKEGARGSDYVLSNGEHPLEPRTYRNYYKKLLEGLGIPYVKFHALRHSFATRCIDGNCDYKTVSSILGHSAINTTLDLYVHPNMDQKRKCIKRMVEMLL